MKFYSTNLRSPQVSFRDAVLHGMPADHGLYMPVTVPEIDAEIIRKLPGMQLGEIAHTIGKLWLSEDIPDSELQEIAYESINFDAPLIEVEKNIYSLELFHGPTHAFKDFGARFMARTMAYLQQEADQETVILVATSGDTGSAVANGFLGVPGIYVVLLYPSGKVSNLQEKQITTLDRNITALEINGTFDDCQMLVKQAFMDEDLNDIMHLTSANSINIARLLPQSFYYFYAYGQAAAFEKPVIFSVPSGNFGNLCGGLLAKKMGLPVRKFIAATNANNIFPNYILKGDFKPTASVKTISNAMDVGNPSNFPRILEIYNNNHSQVKNDIEAQAYSDFITKKTIRNVYEKNKYLLCPHSAIGYLGISDLMMDTEEDCTGIFLATAHPAKFFNVIHEFLDVDIPFPAGLKSVLNKNKESIFMESDYTDFKEFLIRAGWRKG
ncbi:MAG: threonine synthase [Cyclobacteriaceae bacterium]|nr:threonine synthase [Cyclobacteriaceae bacterium]